MSTQAASDFSARVIEWQAQEGRHDLPWQHGGSSSAAARAVVSEPPGLDEKAYRVWLSEIMLQQTQVATVVPYYQRFLDRFPSLQSLAAAPLEDVLRLWSGLGYYARARNLHACAQRLVTGFGGAFPRTPASIETLPGIGRSTAAAIAALAFDVRAAILDANVKRVLARAFGIDGASEEFSTAAALEKRMWSLAEELLPASRIGQYTQGLMDLGATVCTAKKPRCDRCPVADSCIARSQCRVDRLPAPKLRAPRPERAVVMLVLRYRDRVWLQKRPPAGIWAGLWSLPELHLHAFRSDHTLAISLAELHGEIGKIEPLRRFTHVFTHFKLHVEVVQATLAALRFRADDPAAGGVWGGIWLDLDEAAEAALPAPVKKLLIELSPNAQSGLRSTGAGPARPARSRAPRAPTPASS